MQNTHFHGFSTKTCPSSPKTMRKDRPLSFLIAPLFISVSVMFQEGSHICLLIGRLMGPTEYLVTLPLSCHRYFLTTSSGNMKRYEQSMPICLQQTTRKHSSTPTI